MALPQGAIGAAQFAQPSRACTAGRLPLPSLQPEDITDDDSKELRYYDACDGCRCGTGRAS